MEKDDHAERNAKASYDNIAEMVAALECDYDRLEELRDERDSLTSVVNAEADPVMRADAEEELADWDEANGEELKELTDAATLDGDLLGNAETARECIQERPLSVQVRSGWGDVGASLAAEEFEILLSTGGPALRIVGELDERGEPRRAWLEYQDWGTPWTQFFGYDREVLLTFCRVFYFGA